MLILTTAHLDITLDQSFFSLFYFFLFFFLFNFIHFTLVPATKVTVNAFEDLAKLHYIRLILSRKEPYTAYAEN